MTAWDRKASLGFALRLWRRLVRWTGRLGRPRRRHSGVVETGVCFSLHRKTPSEPVATPEMVTLPETVTPPETATLPEAGRLDARQTATLVAERQRVEEGWASGSAFRPLAAICRRGAWVSAQIRDQDGRDIARVALWPEEGELSG